jgi:oligopeptide transport system substrate-binding protein
VAREVVEKYQDAQGQVMGNPVGTGPFYLVKNEWVRGARIVLEANPVYRHRVWDFEAADTPEDRKIAAEMRGKTLPAIGRVEIAVMLEDQSRLLSFQTGSTDVFWLDGPLSPKVLANGQLKPELAAKGVQLSRIPDPEISFYYWNGQDATLGGFSKEKIALRRAIAMAHNVDEEIRIVWNGEAKKLEYPIPPGVVGYDPDYRSINRYDPALANALLDRYGYKKGKDGWRRKPDGSPLVITYTARNESNGVQQTEMWRKTYNALGIRMEGQRMLFADILKADKQCKLQTRTNPVDRRFPGRRQFHAAVLRAEHPPEQQQLFQPSRIRQAVRADAEDARRPGARPAVPQDGAHPRGQRRHADGLCALPQHAGAAKCTGLQEASDPVTPGMDNYLRSAVTYRDKNEIEEESRCLLI